MIYYKTGEVQFKVWIDENEKSHRENGPAEIEYNDDNTIKNEKWYNHGRLLH